MSRPQKVFGIYVFMFSFILIRATSEAQLTKPSINIPDKPNLHASRRPPKTRIPIDPGPGRR
jgi:hypothetical protein